MRKANADIISQQLGDWSKWAANKSNQAFFTEALKTMENEFGIGNQGMMTIGLVGSCDIPGVKLRQAQSIARWDRKPSKWSHAFLIANKWNGKTNVNKLRIYEVPLFARTGEFPKPINNGMTWNPNEPVKGQSVSTLGLYDDASIHANVALLAVCERSLNKNQDRTIHHLSNKDLKRVSDRAKDLNFDRLRYNLWENLSAWKRFLWSDDEGTNPLRSGVPICCSSYVEMAFEAIGLDLVPTASERNSTPEHIWTAARWFYQENNIRNDDVESKYEMVGCYAIRDGGCTVK